MLRAQEGLEGCLLDTEERGKVVGVGTQGSAEVCLEGVQGILTKAALRDGRGI